MITSLNTTLNGNSYLKSHFTELIEFNNWADNRVINWINQITDEQWNRGAVSSFGNIRDTAVHIVSAKKIWLDFWTKAPTPIYLSVEFTGTKEELIALWKTTSFAHTTFIQNLPYESYLDEVRVMKPNGETITMPFIKTLPHMVNHSTYHRGQLVTLLRQSGFLDLSNTDLFTYIATQSV